MSPCKPLKGFYVSDNLFYIICLKANFLLLLLLHWRWTTAHIEIWPTQASLSDQHLVSQKQTFVVSLLRFPISLLVFAPTPFPRFFQSSVIFKILSSCPFHTFPVYLGLINFIFYMHWHFRFLIIVLFSRILMLLFMHGSLKTGSTE